MDARAIPNDRAATPVFFRLNGKSTEPCIQLRSFKFNEEGTPLQQPGVPPAAAVDKATQTAEATQDTSYPQGDGTGWQTNGPGCPTVSYRQR